MKQLMETEKVENCDVEKANIKIYYSLCPMLRSGKIVFLNNIQELPFLWTTTKVSLYLIIGQREYHQSGGGKNKNTAQTMEARKVVHKAEKGNDF
jgi:hypothetical protein